MSSSSHRQLTHTTLASCTNIHCTQFLYCTPIFHLHFILCMHHVKFNIFHSAQISVHTTEYTIAKQLILILMCVLTKLLCVKKYLHTPCAHYYVCVHCAKLNSMCSSTHNNLPCGATIYRAHWHAIVFLCGAKIYHARANTPTFFHRHSVTPILVTSKLLFCEYSLQLNPTGPSKINVELKL
jgi:hypothetical protein